jgi:hypothetical protein
MCDCTEFKRGMSMLAYCCLIFIYCVNGWVTVREVREGIKLFAININIDLLNQLIIFWTKDIDR